MLADFLSEAAPAARHGRATAKPEAVEPNSRCFKKALKRVFSSDLPAPASNYRVLWGEIRRPTYWRFGIGDSFWENAYFKRKYRCWLSLVVLRAFAGVASGQD